MKKTVSIKQKKLINPTALEFSQNIKTLDSIYESVANLRSHSQSAPPNTTANPEPIYGIPFSLDDQLPNKHLQVFLRNYSKGDNSKAALEKREDVLTELALFFKPINSANQKSEKLALVLNQLRKTKLKLLTLPECDNAGKKLNDLFYLTEHIVEIRRYLFFENLQAHFQQLKQIITNVSEPVLNDVEHMVNHSNTLEAALPGLLERERKALAKQPHLDKFLVQKHRVSPKTARNIDPILKEKRVSWERLFIPYEASKNQEHTKFQSITIFLIALSNCKSGSGNTEINELYNTVMKPLNDLFRSMIDHFEILNMIENYDSASIFGHALLDILKDIYGNEGKESEESLRRIVRPAILKDNKLYHLQKQVAYAYQRSGDYTIAGYLFQSLYNLDHSKHSSCLHHIARNMLLKYQSDVKTNKHAMSDQPLHNAIKLIEGLMVDAKVMLSTHPTSNPEQLLLNASRLRVAANLKLNLAYPPLDHCLADLRKSMDLLEKYPHFTYECRHSKVANLTQIGKIYEEKYNVSSSKEDLQSALEAYQTAKDMLAPMLSTPVALEPLLKSIKRVKKLIDPNYRDHDILSDTRSRTSSTSSLYSKMYEENPYIIFEPGTVNVPATQENPYEMLVQPVYMDMQEANVTSAISVRKELLNNVSLIYEDSPENTYSDVRPESLVVKPGRLYEEIAEFTQTRHRKNPMYESIDQIRAHFRKNPLYESSGNVFSGNN